MKTSTKFLNFAPLCIFIIGLISSHAGAVQIKKVEIQSVRPDALSGWSWPGEKGRKREDVGGVCIRFSLKESGEFKSGRDFRCTCHYFDKDKNLIESRGPNLMKKRGGIGYLDEPVRGHKTEEIYTTSNLILKQKTRYIIVVMKFRGDYALGLWPTGINPREFEFPDKDIAIQHATESGTLR